MTPVDRYFTRLLACHVALALAVLAPPLPSAHADPCVRAYDEVRRPLREWLADPHTTGADIIASLSQSSKKLNALFAADSGVMEGYTIQEHTLRVYKVFAGQVAKWAVPAEHATLLKYVIALHDIGKPEAIAAGSKQLQHQYTLPILASTMKKAGFTAPEVRVAEALVGNDVIGAMLQQRITPTEAHRRLLVLAEKSGLNPMDFFRLQSFYYTCDAASYPYLMENVFRKGPDGTIRPDSPFFTRLEQLFQAAH
ncbi:MAG: hypothetical protein NDJ90_09035 [Oligoflexia bacterium]|nr:hypothetical protein [Oligoflexia bacterium]